MSITSLTSLPERIRVKIVVQEDGCWNWTGQRCRNYGRYEVRDRKAGTRQVWRAHRLVWTLLRGPCPTDTLDHLCSNTLCVNPDHLEPVTRGENTRRYYAALTTHCPEGHPYDDGNTYYKPGTRKRTCRACRRAAMGARRRA